MKPEIKYQPALYSKIADERLILSNEQLEIIYHEKWFKLFRIDGSFGWTVTLCSGASQFIGYLSLELSEKVFRNEKVCFGGSGAITGTARGLSHQRIVEICNRRALLHSFYRQLPDSKKESSYSVSEAIESAHRTLVQKRMKRSGQRWNCNGAQNMLNLRVVRKNND